MDLQITSNSPGETIELGRRIGRALKGGEIIALYGPLGSGKTHLVKGIAAGAGAGEHDRVNSPTFVIVNEYPGNLHIYHVDAYRLGSVAELELLGFDEYCHAGSVVVIEWADRIEPALASLDFIAVTLEHTGPEKRLIHLKNLPRYIQP